MHKFQTRILNFNNIWLVCSRQNKVLLKSRQTGAFARIFTRYRWLVYGVSLFYNFNLFNYYFYTHYDAYAIFIILKMQLYFSFNIYLIYYLSFSQISIWKIITSRHKKNEKNQNKKCVRCCCNCGVVVVGDELNIFLFYLLFTRLLFVNQNEMIQSFMQVFSRQFY